MAIPFFTPRLKESDLKPATSYTIPTSNVAINLTGQNVTIKLNAGANTNVKFILGDVHAVLG